MRTAAGLLAALALGSCGGTPVSLAVAWRFVDGRGCAETSVTQVVLFGAASCQDFDAGAHPCRFACAAGEDGQSVTVLASVPGTLDAQAESLSGAALYRGTVALGPPGSAAAPTVVPLYFTGGQ